MNFIIGLNCFIFGITLVLYFGDRDEAPQISSSKIIHNHEYLALRNREAVKSLRASSNFAREIRKNILANVIASYRNL